MIKSNKRIEWEARLNDWKASGLSKAKWCRENGFKEHQMYYWLQRIDGPESIQSNQNRHRTDFLPINVTDELNKPTGSILIHIDRVSVEIQPAADIGLLSRLLPILQS